MTDLRHWSLSLVYIAGTAQVQLPVSILPLRLAAVSPELDKSLEDN